MADVAFWSDAALRRRPANFAPLTPVTFLARAAEVFAEREAVAYGAHRETWAEHAATCRRFASALQRAGIDRGDVVSVLLGNTPPMLAAHFAVPMAGAVLNTINTRIEAETLTYILAHCGARLLIVDAEFLPLAREAMRALPKPGLRVVVYVDAEAGFAAPADAERLEDFVASGEPTPALPPVQDEWFPISVNYTSGTTGRPKGVVLSHRGAYLAALSSVVDWNMPRHPSYLWTLPMFHCNGWCMPWLLALEGGKSVCLRKVEAERAVSLMVDEAVTHYCGAPLVHQMLLEEAERRGLRFDPPVQALVAAAPPPAALFEGMARVGVTLTHVYGLTEVYGPASVCEPRAEWAALDPEQRAARIARQGVRYALQDGMTVINPETMQPVPADGKTAGEIMFRGNIMMMGYLGDAEGTDQAFAGGWFHSGDIAVLDADGYARILDRSKDIIISGGENISSVEVEDVLYRHPAIAAAAVVAMPHPRWGETPVALVELHEGRQADEQEIIAFCRAHLAHFKCPTRVVQWEIPKTSTGKIQKNVLRERVRRELAAPNSDQSGAP